MKVKEVIGLPKRGRVTGSLGSPVMTCRQGPSGVSCGKQASVAAGGNDLAGLKDDGTPIPEARSTADYLEV